MHDAYHAGSEIRMKELAMNEPDVKYDPPFPWPTAIAMVLIIAVYSMYLLGWLS